jgi:hypothetical protein
MVLIREPKGRGRCGGGRRQRFVQVFLFREGAWAVRYEIACPFVDASVARTQTLAFLKSLRARE